MSSIVNQLKSRMNYIQLMNSYTHMEALETSPEVTSISISKTLIFSPLKDKTIVGISWGSDLRGGGRRLKKLLS